MGKKEDERLKGEKGQINKTYTKNKNKTKNKKNKRQKKKNSKAKTCMHLKEGALGEKRPQTQ